MRKQMTEDFSSSSAFFVFLHFSPHIRGVLGVLIIFPMLRICELG
jgi:hypothetical protein